MANSFGAFALLLIFMGGLTHLILFRKYRAAMNSSIASVERISIYFEMHKINLTYHKLRDDGYFSKTPALNEYVDKWFENVFSLGQLNLYKIRMRVKLLPSFDDKLFEEWQTCDISEKKWWADFNLLLARLHKVNDPINYSFSYSFLGLKKTLLPRILPIFVLISLVPQAYRKLIQKYGNPKMSGDYPKSGFLIIGYRF